MGKKSLMRRLVAMKSKVDLQRLRSGWIEDGEWETLERTASDLSRLQIFINDTAGNPIASMRSQLKRLAKEQGGIDMVIVDYLGLVGSSSDEKRPENRVQEVSKISRDLKQLSREFDVPFIVLAQLSRAVESRQNKRPQLSDLRDSGSIEQDADVIMFLYRDAYYAQQEGREVEQGKENLAEVYISKQRNGPTGDVSLYFHPTHGMFYNLDTANM
jgi:replicative DNA helicase